MDENGQDKMKLPAIVIGWDEAAQAHAMQFNPAEFKTWDMVLAVLDMARSEAEFKRDLVRKASLVQAQRQAQSDMAIRQQLKL